MTSHDPREVTLLAQRPFVLFWFARVFAMVAHQMLAVAVGWQIYTLTGRALALFTMAMFLGVAAMQWFTGWVAALAPALDLDPFVATLAAIAALLAAGAFAYIGLPAPPRK